VINIRYDTTSAGNVRRHLIFTSFDAILFNELLAIGELNGKIYVFDMLRFGSPSGSSPAQARLYPFGCQ
jgi:hypothetical protein